MQAAHKNELEARPEINSELFVSSQVAQGLAVIGDRWSFLILRDVYLGVNRFENLRKSLECNRGTLTARLKNLTNQEILAKKLYQSSPPRSEYCLTEKGLDLYPIVLTIWRWENTWAKHHYLPQVLKHNNCGKKMLPVYRCRTCRTELSAQDTRFTTRQEYDAAEQVAARSQRRSKSNSEKVGELSKDTMSVLDCVGDRWTSLVLAAVFFGLQRFDDMAMAIQIGTSVLADRLSLLVMTGILNRVQYQSNPPRYEYRLTNKGRDLYSHIIAIHEWTERWLIKPDRGLVQLQHLPCDKPFRGEVVCSECDEVLHPHQVSYVNN